MHHQKFKPTTSYEKSWSILTPTAQEKNKKAVNRRYHNKIEDTDTNAYTFSRDLKEINSEINYLNIRRNHYRRS